MISIDMLKNYWKKCVNDDNDYTSICKGTYLWIPPKLYLDHNHAIPPKCVRHVNKIAGCVKNTRRIKQNDWKSSSQLSLNAMNTVWHECSGATYLLGDDLHLGWLTRNYSKSNKKSQSLQQQQLAPPMYPFQSAWLFHFVHLEL